MSTKGKDPKPVKLPVTDGKVVVDSPEKGTQTVYDLIKMMEPQAEEFLLPTKGLLYPFDRVMIRPMTSKEEKRIASLNVRNFNVKMNAILSSCVKNPEIFDPSVLTIGDRSTLVTWLRIHTYGQEYVTEVTCPRCQSLSRETYDLMQLDDMWLPDDYSEPYFIELDSIPGGVNLRLIRVLDEMKLESHLTQMRKVKNIDKDDEWSYRFASTIVDIIVNGQPMETTYKDKVIFFEGLPGSDALKIRNFHRRFDHGVDMRVSYECSNCDLVMDKMALNINASFFIPTQTGE